MFEKWQAEHCARRFDLLVSLTKEDAVDQIVDSGNNLGDDRGESIFPQKGTDVAGA